MPVESVGFNFGFLDFSAAVVVKIFLLLFLVFYFVFAFVLYKQIAAMGSELTTKNVPFLKFIARVHIAVVIALILIVIGSF